MTIDDADYTCGFMGFCGWVVNVDDHELNYHAGLNLESTGLLHTRYMITEFSEDDTPYTRSLDKLFTTMCATYQPAKKQAVDRITLIQP
jgi:hypothetical protein